MIQKSDKSELDVDVYRTAVEFQRIMNQGVHEAQEEARRAGVPNVYSIHRILHWELPDGSLSTNDPYNMCDSNSGLGPA